jgi:hypothetical protein
VCPPALPHYLFPRAPATARLPSLRPAALARSLPPPSRPTSMHPAALPHSIDPANRLPPRTLLPPPSRSPALRPTAALYYIFPPARHAARPPARAHPPAGSNHQRTHLSAIPATNGAAMLVPLILSYRPSAIVERMFDPGAATVLSRHDCQAGSVSGLCMLIRRGCKCIRLTNGVASRCIRVSKAAQRSFSQS